MDEDQNQPDGGQPISDQGGGNQPPENQPTAAGGAPKCQSCGMDTSGYKCAVCGEESTTHDEAHACGEENCQPKCVGCNQADSKCSCGASQAPSEGGVPPATPGV